MKQKNGKTTVQNLKHKAARRPAKESESQFDNQWMFLEDEQDIVGYQHAYEFAPENRYFN